MSGILAIVGHQVQNNPNAANERLSRGLSAIERRGPDSQGVWCESNAMLGHVRLANIDPNACSDQPMHSMNWTLSYDGVIYNFRDIRADLEKLGHSFSTQSDTEVLLLSLEQWGIEKTLSRLAGMFAFVAVSRQSNQVFVARDHMGIRPVIYAHGHDGTLYIGSSIAAVKGMNSDGDFAVNMSALGTYMALGCVHGSHTAYSGIDRLAPAHYMTVAPNGDIETKKYWSPEYQRDFRMDDLISVAREYQISDVKSALFLSGGVNSSFLASIYDNMPCFHLTSPEEPYAKMVADIMGREFISVESNLDDYEADFEGATKFHGEPLTSLGASLSALSGIRARGFKMAISAHGADELFLGYDRTPTPENMPTYLPLHESKSKQYLLEQLQHIFRDSRNFDMPTLNQYIPSMHDLTLECMENYSLPGFPASSSHRWLELMTYVLSDLNPTLDASSMYNSVEVRAPFLDHRIVQGVLSWGASQLVTPELGRKAPLKEHLNKYFPAGLHQRPKLDSSIHTNRSGDIADLSQQTLDDFVASNFLKLPGDVQRGEYTRDRIYVCESLFALSKWDDKNQVMVQP